MIVMTKTWTLVRKYEEVYVSNDFYNYFLGKSDNNDSLFRDLYQFPRM